MNGVENKNDQFATLGLNDVITIEKVVNCELLVVDSLTTSTTDWPTVNLIEKANTYPEPVCLRESTNPWGKSDACMQLLAEEDSCFLKDITFWMGFLIPGSRG